MVPKPLLALATREALSVPRLERRAGSAKAFDSNQASLRAAEEASMRALQGVYHFCALAASRILPEGGLVLDLGSGAGGFAMYLADRRPDVTIIGLESFPGRVELGQQLIAEANLQDRLCIYQGEITDFSKRITNSIDMVTGILCLHQLNTVEDLLRCFHDISYVRIRGGCGVFLFDWARPNMLKTAEEFGPAFIPGAALSIGRECRNALLSSYTFEEMSDALGKVSLGTVNHAQPKGLHTFQAHWLERGDKMVIRDLVWADDLRVPPATMKQYKDLRTLMPSVPMPKYAK